MHVPVAAAAAGVAVTGKSLFDYNRANFQNDIPQRFARFLTSRNMLNAQVGQYRQDVQGIATLTSSKMDAVMMMMTLILCVCAALSDAGRVGMHGSAPPQWFCGLYAGCICSAILFMGAALWLAMHASLRAQCAMVSLLTRKVRLPIPSMAQLDNARGFGSAFEQQKFGDIFRVPFMRHPEAAPELPAGYDDEEVDVKGKKGKKKGSKSDSEGVTKKSKKSAKVSVASEFGSTTRDTVPSWIRDEQVVDKAGGVMKAGATDDLEENSLPDHFKMLAKAQEEWWQYEVYARILMLYGTCQFLYAVSYYSIGTTMCELRGFWISWSLPMTFLAGQALIMRLDIVRGEGKHYLPHTEWLGHIAPYFAIGATTLEYRYVYNQYAVVVTWILVYLAYFAHMTMALRMLDLAWPSDGKELPDQASKTWWPSHWRVPSAFGKNLWLLAPPKKLEDGQHDLLHEMEALQATSAGVTTKKRKSVSKEGKGEGLTEVEVEAPEEAEGDGAYTGDSPFKDFGIRRAGDLPWQLARVAIATVAFQWFYMGIAVFSEMLVGIDVMMKEPGEPPWIRDQKDRKWHPDMYHESDESIPSDYRLYEATMAQYPNKAFIGGFNPLQTLSSLTSYAGEPTPDPSLTAEATFDAEDDNGARRLGATETAIQDLMKALPKLSWLVDALEKQSNQTALWHVSPEPETEASASFMAPTAKTLNVIWPALFEPHHLLCKGSTVVALTSRGFGALASLSDKQAQAMPFSLVGVSELGPLAGAAWTDAGLSLVTKAGVLLTCAGNGPDAGRWTCAVAKAARLPLPSGASLISAALSESKERTIALIFQHNPGQISLFKEGASGWMPQGEIHLPQAAGVHIGLSFAGQELLAILGKSGEVHRRNLLDGTSAWTASPPAGPKREFRSACSASASSSGLLRLALSQKLTSHSHAWVTELISE